jgi:hypothetical protein
MAREVKATAYTNRHYPDRTTYTFGPEQLKAFVDLVRADQREIDAKICDELAGILICHNDQDGADICISLRDTIRAAGETK